MTPWDKYRDDQYRDSVIERPNPDPRPTPPPIEDTGAVHPDGAVLQLRCYRCGTATQETQRRRPDSQWDWRVVTEHQTPEGRRCTESNAKWVKWNGTPWPT